VKNVGILKSAFKKTKKVAKKTKSNTRKIAKTSLKKTKKVAKKTKSNTRSFAKATASNIVASVPLPLYSNLLATPSMWRKLVPVSNRPSSYTDIKKNIYFVNGVGNTLRDANSGMIALRYYLNEKPKSTPYAIKLIYNPTLSVPFDGIEAAADKTWYPPTPINNQTTLRVIALLHEAKAKGAPIGIVAHSQGSLIVTNAIYAFSMLDPINNIRYMKKNLKVVFVGIAVSALMGRKVTKKLVKKYEVFANAGDPIALIFGQSKDAWKRSMPKMKAHYFKNYLRYQGKDVLPRNFFE